jgi:peptidoglycan/xylan/chitin deacetylase (PgdA/CDA1 family)
MFGYFLLAVLAATLLIFAPLERGEIRFDNGGASGQADDAIVTGSTTAAAPHCDAERSLAGRELEIDPKGGPRFGTVQFAGSLPLADKEVVLTFDDGPHPTRTPAILDVLDRYCVKAVFFVVGSMVMEHPGVLREVARRGHVIGTHSFSHPFNMTKLGKQRAEEEINAGFAAVAHVLGGPVAPLFRFPGFSHSRDLLDDLSARDITVWSADVITDDSFIGARRITERMFERLGREGRGVVLMHDIKKSTAESLPGILQTLKDTGYSVPRVTVAATIMPDERLMAMFDEGKPRWHGLIHRASQKPGTVRAAIQPSVPFEPFLRDGPALPMQ